MKPAETVDPDPGSLVESLRDFGYTLPSALADLIDNSLTAQARRIQVIVDAAKDAEHIAVIDDGAGMSERQLVDAMKMGTKGPVLHRSADDLGRFGLGLKTASLSQGRCVTVISKTAAGLAPVVRRWDLGHIQSSGKWQLLENPTAVAESIATRVRGMASGTAVVIEALDRPSFLRVSPSELHEHLAHALEGIRQHLAMVFHRFIDEGIEIKLGPSVLQAWDPFMRRFSKALPSETLPFANARVSVSAFVLPHHSRLSDEEHEHGAGPNGWNAHQGFYIYRCRRLIVPGTWLNLKLKKEEHYKLARIMVDLPNGLDAEWQLNVMKSHVAAPAALKDDFARIASDVRREAANIYRYRGEKALPEHQQPERYIWKRKPSKARVRYVVDRTHPVLSSLLASGCEHDELLETVIRMIESSVPIAAMLQESAKAIDGIPEGGISEIEELMKLFFFTESFLIKNGKTPEAARKRLLFAEPFAQNREAIESRLGMATSTVHEPENSEPGAPR